MKTRNPEQERKQKEMAAAILLYATLFPLCSEAELAQIYREREQLKAYVFNLKAKERKREINLN